MNQGYNNLGINNPTYIPSHSTYPPYMNIPGYTTTNQQQTTQQNSVDPAYVENIFSKNHGKIVHIYLSYPDSLEWRDRVFDGTILASGRDYVLLRDMEGKNVLLWLIYINYAIFDEEISY